MTEALDIIRRGAVAALIKRQAAFAVFSALLERRRCGRGFESIIRMFQGLSRAASECHTLLVTVRIDRAAEILAHTGTISVTLIG